MVRVCHFRTLVSLGHPLSRRDATHPYLAIALNKSFPIPSNSHLLPKDPGGLAVDPGWPPLPSIGLLTALGGPAPNIGEEIPPSHAEALEIVSNDCTANLTCQ